MIKTCLEKFARDIGIDIGRSDNVVQGSLINGLSYGLINSNIHDYETQMAYIVDELTDESKKLIHNLNKFVEEVK